MTTPPPIHDPEAKIEALAPIAEVTKSWLEGCKVTAK